MEQAWRAHLGKLTLDQLDTGDALQAHIKKFKQRASGDMQHACIAKYVATVPVVDESTMKNLAETELNRMDARTWSRLKSIDARSWHKFRFTDSGSRGAMRIELPNGETLYADLVMSRTDHAAQQKVRLRLCQRFRRLGYSVAFR